MVVRIPRIPEQAPPGSEWVVGDTKTVLKKFGSQVGRNTVLAGILPKSGWSVTTNTVLEILKIPTKIYHILVQ